MEDKDNKTESSALFGFLGFSLVMLCNLVFLLLTLFSPAGVIFGISLLFIGVTQLIYVIPLIIVARKKKWIGFIPGAVIAASLTFLLNASCYGILFSGLFL